MPLHAELVDEVREWLRGLGPKQSLFPRLATRKAYKMVQRDLEDAGIPYQTEEGIADFHAAGRHTHITELLRSGVSLPEARELARHSDVRMTMKYTHIGLDDQAKAVNQLPAPKKLVEDAGEKCLHNVCTECGAVRRPEAVADSNREPSSRKKERRNPRLDKDFGATSQRLAVDDPDCPKVEAAGIEPASRNSSTEASTCVADNLVFGSRGVCRRTPRSLRRELCLAAGVPASDLRRFGIGDEQLGLSEKSPQPGQPLFRQP